MSGEGGKLLLSFLLLELGVLWWGRRAAILSRHPFDRLHNGRTPCGCPLHRRQAERGLTMRRIGVGGLAGLLLLLVLSKISWRMQVRALRVRRHDRTLDG